MFEEDSNLILSSVYHKIKVLPAADSANVHELRVCKNTASGEDEK